MDLTLSHTPAHFLTLTNSLGYQNPKAVKVPLKFQGEFSAYGFPWPTQGAMLVDRADSATLVVRFQDFGAITAAGLHITLSQQQPS